MKKLTERQFKKELKLIDDITEAMESRYNKKECKCLGGWLVKVERRVSTCTHCGKIWHWYKTLDASGNWEYEREPLNQKEEKR